MQSGCAVLKLPKGVSALMILFLALAKAEGLRSLANTEILTRLGYANPNTGKPSLDAIFEKSCGGRPFPLVPGRKTTSFPLSVTPGARKTQ